MVSAILDAAARILKRDGRDALNTNAIAREAGISVGSIYQYYPHRDAIIHALVHRHSRRIHDRVALAGEPPARSIGEAAERIVRAVFAAHRIDPALHDALDHDFGHDHPGDPHGHAHATTKSAARAVFRHLPTDVLAQIRCPIDLAPLVVSEIVHALAHAALVHPADPHAEAAIERHAIHVVRAYLTTAMAA